MNKTCMVLSVVAVVGVWACTSRAASVYVSETATDTAYATYNSGYGGQTGAADNPFGSISAAYHYLYGQAGDHEILLVADGDGVLRGGELGQNEFGNGDGYLRMVSGNQFPTTAPLWTTVTLKPAPGYEGDVTLRMTDADITSPTEGGHNAYPAAYEKEVPNPGGANNANRGQVIRGLWNPGTSMPLPGMIVEGLTIVIGGGHVLIGTTASIGGTSQNFTFNNCDVYLQSDMADDLGAGFGDPWGKSALFVSHMNEADLALSSLDFHNSTIYLVPDDDSAWIGNFYVGQTWGSGTWYKFPSGLIDGNNTSYLKYWDGSEYVEWAQPDGLGCSIWQSGRNAGNTLTAYENGAGANNLFLVNFNDVPPPPPPTGAVLIVK